MVIKVLNELQGPRVYHTRTSERSYVSKKEDDDSKKFMTPYKMDTNPWIIWRCQAFQFHCELPWFKTSLSPSSFLPISCNNLKYYCFNLPFKFGLQAQAKVVGFLDGLFLFGVLCCAMDYLWHLVLVLFLQLLISLEVHSTFSPPSKVTNYPLV